jgi:GTP-binding protein HflX
LERQKGGIGLRGPGETQLETDRRLLGERIKLLNRKLEKVNKQREQGRRARRRAALPTVSLVGYTNAGKSTLFNAVTESQVFAANQLFATLDPTLRRVELAEGQAIVLADTVGFIRQLPHDLVAAFRSTLQETRDADLLLHIVDAASQQREDNINQVNTVLTEIEAESRPQLLVFNKIDLLANVPAHIDRDDEGKPIRVWLSARTGEGLPLLLQAISEILHRATVHEHLVLPPAEGKLHARLHAMGSVVLEDIDSQGRWLMTIAMPAPTWDSLNKHFHLDNYISHDPVADRLAVSGEAP